MAYADVLTGNWNGNFAYLTRKQANVIYATYKRGDIAMSKAQANEMYDAVGDTENEGAYAFYKQVLDFIFKKRLDLAQALLDGKQVRYDDGYEEVAITQDMLDNPEKYGIDDVFFELYEVGDMYEIKTHEGRWVVL